MGNADETCANCGDVVGQLETPMVWHDHVVCARCHAKLAASNRAAPAVERLPRDASGRVAQYPPGTGGPVLRCPHCDYYGSTKTRGKKAWTVVSIFGFLMDDPLVAVGGAVGAAGKYLDCPVCNRTIAETGLGGAVTPRQSMKPMPKWVLGMLVALLLTFVLILLIGLGGVR